MFQLGKMYLLRGPASPQISVHEAFISELITTYQHLIPGSANLCSLTNGKIIPLSPDCPAATALQLGTEACLGDSKSKPRAVRRGTGFGLDKMGPSVSSFDLLLGAWPAQKPSNWNSLSGLSIPTRYKFQPLW